MNKERKQLKEYSVVILILAVLSLVRLIVDVCVYGFDPSTVNIEGANDDIIKASLIITFVLSIILFIPDIYVGFKGMKEAKNPTGARAHIVWALILAILATIATVSSIVDIANTFNVSKLLQVVDVAADAAIFFAYYLTAKKVARVEE